MQAIILDQKLKFLVASERKVTHEILLVIQTLDITQSFRELGYSSLFEYLTKEIGYSEGSAQRRISSARLMKQVPAIANDLKLGKLNLTQVSLAQAAIRQEERARARCQDQNQNHSQSPPQKISLPEKVEILEKLKSKNTFETQKILKEALPAFEIPKPKAIPFEKDKVHVTLQFSETDWEKVQSLMAHFSHTIPDQKIESLLLYWHTQVENKKRKQLEKVEEKKQKQSEKAEKTEKVEKIKATADANDLRNKDLDQKKVNLDRKASQIADQKEVASSSADCLDQNLKSSDILPPLRQRKTDGLGRSRSQKADDLDLSRSLRNDDLDLSHRLRNGDLGLSHRQQKDGLKRPSRSSISTAIKIQVRRHAKEQCEYISQVTGRRCESKHFLETEHRVPVALGGTDAIENLRLYCRAHNALEAKHWGISK